MKSKFWLWIATLTLMLACRIPMFSPSSPTDSQDPAAPLLPFLEPTPIPSTPIGLRQGLASLNSYRLEIRTINNGPSARDRNEITYLMESASDGESWHISTSALVSSAEEPEIETSQIDQYKVGNRMCAISDEGSEAEESEVDPQAQEIMDVLYGLIDLVPLVNDPIFIGTENLNGVLVNHFRFNVSGLGVTSGADVVFSSGEYWLAVDGQFIVRYDVVIETRSGPAGDPSAKTMHSEFHIEVKDINQPISISIPPACP